MIKVFIDANVLISVLNRQYPLFRMSARVLSLADNPQYCLVTSATSLAITFYFACKKCGEKNALEKMRMLCSKLEVSQTGHDEVASALSNPKVHDFEDGILHYSAKNAGCKYLVTEDLEDFFFSEIPVMNCESFLRNVALSSQSPKRSKGYPMDDE